MGSECRLAIKLVCIFEVIHILPFQCPLVEVINFKTVQGLKFKVKGIPRYLYSNVEISRKNLLKYLIRHTLNCRGAHYLTVELCFHMVY